VTATQPPAAALLNSAEHAPAGTGFWWGASDRHATSVSGHGYGRDGRGDAGGRWLWRRHPRTRAAAPPPGNPPFAQRAAQILRAWHDGELAARWRTALVLVSSADLTYSAASVPLEAATTAVTDGRYRLAVPLPRKPPRPGVVEFPDGDLKVPLLSAAAAYRALDRGLPAAGCIRSGCPPLAVTGANLGTVLVSSSRGLALAPAWQFSLAGQLLPVMRLAVAPPAVAALPHPILPEHDVRYRPVVNAIRDPGDPLRVTIWLKVGRCDVHPHTAVTETGQAVVVAGLVTPRYACSSPEAGGFYQTTITLRAPPGARLVFDASSGLPLTVRPGV